MKVLYLAHYKEQTGWARAAIDNILALEAAGLDVVCRNIPLTGANKTPEELVHMEMKECYDATHCIQHVLPHHLVGSDRHKKNIAYFVSEGSSTLHMDWHSHLQLVDEVWVPNEWMYSSLTSEGFISAVVNHCCDPLKYTEQYPEVSIPELDHTFKFYTICDFNDRKNIESIIRCFHSEFDESEPVSLIIKVNSKRYTDEKLKREVDLMASRVKSRLRMYRNPAMYKKEFVITGHSTESEIMSLHQYADCFLNFSHGEAWSIPTFDAMAFGNTPVATLLPGIVEYVENEDLGLLINGNEQICDSSDVAFPDLLTGRESWIQIDEELAKVAMRHYYENRKDRRSIGIKQAKNFSHEKIGNKMRAILDE